MKKKKRRNGLCTLTHALRGKVIVFLVCSYSIIYAGKSNHIHERPRAAEPAKVHRSCSLFQGPHHFAWHCLKNYHTIQIPQNQARNCLNSFMSIVQLVIVLHFLCSYTSQVVLILKAFFFFFSLLVKVFKAFLIAVRHTLRNFVP